MLLMCGCGMVCGCVVEIWYWFGCYMIEDWVYCIVMQYCNDAVVGRDLIKISSPPPWALSQTLMTHPSGSVGGRDPT